MIVDRLFERVSKVGHVCVGLDTSLEYLPSDIKREYTSITDSLFHFNKRIIDATLDIAACFKLQIAYYEAYGIEGLMAYKQTLEYLRKKRAIVIADIKRGDIAKTAQMYAKAHFDGDFEADFITLSPYMGMDSVEPYLDYVKNKEKGLFILLRTSNKGSQDFQYIEDKRGTRLYNSVGEKISELGERYLGSTGYSSIGAVVGGNNTDEGIEIRKRFSSLFFLVPGYGAQGGGKGCGNLFKE